VAESEKSGNGVADSPSGRAVRRMLVDNGFALAKAPKIGTDIAGKVWNLPNTAIGMGYGLAGYAAGQVNRLRPGDQPDPRIQFGHSAVEFIDNPAGGVGAITLGNTTTYAHDPYDPTDRDWYPGGEDPKTVENGHSWMEHEQSHTRQGEQLGPAYLLSNLFGGLNSLVRDRDPETGRPIWHGEHNWNERGPARPQPVPWAPKEER
jgi:hypothetical protein